MTAKRQPGFTLLELMITIAVVAILVAIAYPSMTAFLQRDQAVAQSNNIRANLQFARGQAAATRAYVSICPLVAAGGTTCATTGVYDLGWMVYSAAAPNVVYNAATAGNAILLSVAAPTNASIRSNQTGALTYNARGELLPSTTSVTFTICAKTSPSNSIGTNTTKVPGIILNASSSGRVASNKLGAGAACS